MSQQRHGIVKLESLNLPRTKSLFLSLICTQITKQQIIPNNMIHEVMDICSNSYADNQQQQEEDEVPWHQEAATAVAAAASPAT